MEYHKAYRHQCYRQSMYHSETKAGHNKIYMPRQPISNGYPLEDDQRQDSMNGAEYRGGAWEEFTTTVQTIGDFIFEWKDEHCQSPCFVKPTKSMDSNARMEPPASCGNYCKNSCNNHNNVPEVHLAPRQQPEPQQEQKYSNYGTPPIRFPSIHLDGDESGWENEEDDDVFLKSSDLNGAFGPKQNVYQVQSIYRTPSHIAVMQSPFGTNHQISSMTNFGIYRCPAFAAYEDEDSSNIVTDASSIESADWDDISPPHSRGNSQEHVIDVTNMEELLNGCQL